MPNSIDAICFDSRALLLGAECVGFLFLASCQMWQAVWHFPEQVLGAPEHSSVALDPLCSDFPFLHISLTVLRVFLRSLCWFFSLYFSASIAH